MDRLLDLLPIVVGALIAVVPTLIGKYLDRKNHKEDDERAKKQAMYIELIEQIGKVLTDFKIGMCTTDTEKNVGKLRNMINLISIIGSNDVVKSLNAYLATWGNEKVNKQTSLYTELLRAIRVDLKVDKEKNANFPEIGLIDIRACFQKDNDAKCRIILQR